MRWQDLGSAVVILCVAAGFFGFYRWLRRGIVTLALDTMSRWAKQNHVEVVAWKYSEFINGPFWLSHFGQPVFRVTILDATGRELRGWIRCGSHVFGRWRERVQVKWDEPA